MSVRPPPLTQPPVARHRKRPLPEVTGERYRGDQGALMGYRERRKERKAIDQQRSGALGLALLSGHGGGLFLSVLTPLQLVGRTTPEFVGLSMLVGAGFALAFGRGLAAAWNGLNSDGEGRENNAKEFIGVSLNAALYNFLAVVTLLVLGGLSMFAPEFRTFAFGSPKPAESSTPPPAPAVSPSPAALAHPPT